MKIDWKSKKFRAASMAVIVLLLAGDTAYFCTDEYPGSIWCPIYHAEVPFPPPKTSNPMVGVTGCFRRPGPEYSFHIPGTEFPPSCRYGR